MRPATLLHLSDVHLGAAASPRGEFWESLASALTKAAAEAAGAVAVVVTGDVIDSPEVVSDGGGSGGAEGVASFLDRLARALANAGHDGAPIVLLPGNHDRRTSGLLRPWTHAAMTAVAGLAGARATVVAADAHQPLAVRVPALEAALGLTVVAYDSTHTIPGLASAGGLIRVEDLLAVPGLFESERPTLVLMHHHLVPTPVTDVGVTDTSHQGGLKRAFVDSVLPRLVTFGNREELFMTALGAGTGLSALAALRTPAIVLHGHKHYPTARLMTATTPGDGDVLLASAGSAGVLEGFSVTGTPAEPGADGEPPRRLHLWPSFNVLSWDGEGRLDVVTEFFSPQRQNPDQPGAPPVFETRRQALAVVQRRGRRWLPRDDDEFITPYAALVELDEARFALKPGLPGFWDFECTRLVEGGPAERLADRIEAARGAALHGPGMDPKRRLFTFTRGAPASYAVERGVCRTVGAMQRVYAPDDFSPFEWVGLRVRRGAAVARLEARGLPAGTASRAFASLTDLHTGDVRPLRVAVVDGVARVEVPRCPARRLLRLHWPLEDA